MGVAALDLVGEHADVGAWHTTKNKGRGIRWVWSLRSRGHAGRGEGRLQLGFRHGARAKTEGLCLGKQREKRSSMGSPPGFLAVMA